MQKLIPYMRTDDVLEASHCPSDGHLMPSDLHDAFVRLARENGAEIRVHSPVDEILVRGGSVAGVKSGGKEIHSPVVVNATGPWSYVVAGRAGTVLATCAIGHYYITTVPDRGRRGPHEPSGARPRQPDLAQVGECWPGYGRSRAVRHGEPSVRLRHERMAASTTLERGASLQAATHASLPRRASAPREPGS